MTIINSKFLVTGPMQAREYRVIKEFDGKEIAVVEIPWSGRPQAFYASSKAGLISIVYQTIHQSRNCDWTFVSWTEKTLTDCFGDEIPEDALAIAKEHDTVIQYNDTWARPSDADEYRWAIEYLQHDIYGLHTFTVMVDAIKFLVEYNGHGNGDAEEALAKVLCAYGFIEIAVDDEE